MQFVDKNTLNEITNIFRQVVLQQNCSAKEKAEDISIGQQERLSRFLTTYYQHFQNYMIPTDAYQQLDYMRILTKDIKVLDFQKNYMFNQTHCDGLYIIMKGSIEEIIKDASIENSPSQSLNEQKGVSQTKLGGFNSRRLFKVVKMIVGINRLKEPSQTNSPMTTVQNSPTQIHSDKRYKGSLFESEQPLAPQICQISPLEDYANTQSQRGNVSRFFNSPKKGKNNCVLNDNGSLIEREQSLSPEIGQMSPFKDSSNAYSQIKNFSRAIHSQRNEKGMEMTTENTNVNKIHFNFDLEDPTMKGVPNNDMGLQKGQPETSLFKRRIFSIQKPLFLNVPQYPFVDGLNRAHNLLQAGEAFEQTPSSDKIKNYTTTDQSDCVCLYISKKAMERAYREQSEQLRFKIKVLEKVLLNVSLSKMLKLAYQMYEKVYFKNKVLFKQGSSQPNNIYIIKSGEVIISERNISKVTCISNKKETKVAHLGDKNVNLESQELQDLCLKKLDHPNSPQFGKYQGFGHEASQIVLCSLGSTEVLGIEDIAEGNEIRQMTAVVCSSVAEFFILKQEVFQVFYAKETESIAFWLKSKQLFYSQQRDLFKRIHDHSKNHSKEAKAVIKRNYQYLFEEGHHTFSQKSEKNQPKQIINYSNCKASTESKNILSRPSSVQPTTNETQKLQQTNQIMEDQMSFVQRQLAASNKIVSAKQLNIKFNRDKSAKQIQDSLQMDSNNTYRESENLSQTALGSLTNIKQNAFFFSTSNNPMSNDSQQEKSLNQSLSKSVGQTYLCSSLNPSTVLNNISASPLNKKQRYSLYFNQTGKNSPYKNKSNHQQNQDPQKEHNIDDPYQKAMKISKKVYCKTGRGVSPREYLSNTQRERTDTSRNSVNLGKIERQIQTNCMIVSSKANFIEMNQVFKEPIFEELKAENLKSAQKLIQQQKRRGQRKEDIYVNSSRSNTAEEKSMNKYNSLLLKVNMKYKQLQKTMPSTPVGKQDQSNINTCSFSKKNSKMNQESAEVVNIHMEKKRSKQKGSQLYFTRTLSKLDLKLSNTLTKTQSLERKMSQVSPLIKYPNRIN